MFLSLFLQFARLVLISFIGDFCFFGKLIKGSFFQIAECLSVDGRNEMISGMKSAKFRGRLLDKNRGQKDCHKLSPNYFPEILVHNIFADIKKKKNLETFRLSLKFF